MDGWGFLEQGAELARRGESFALATVVWRQGPSSGKESCRAIITAAGELHGWIGGACAEPVVIRQAGRSSPRECRGCCCSAPPISSAGRCPRA